jgi:hypothetical protein
LATSSTRTTCGTTTTAGAQKCGIEKTKNKTVGRGVFLGEIFNVKELAEDCAADGVYEYLFVAPAIPITGAVGSPVNPLAIK